MKHKAHLLLIFVLVYFGFNAQLTANDRSPKLTDPLVILSFSTKKVLDLPAGTQEHGAPISTYTYNRGPNQSWMLQKKEKGYLIVSYFSHQFLTANPKDSSIIQQPFDDSAYQYWTLQTNNDSTRFLNKAIHQYLSLSDKKGELRLSAYKHSDRQVWAMINNYNHDPIRDFIYGSYLDKLKRDTHYDARNEIQIPSFTYQTAFNPNLSLLRIKYKLDSIAGSGNEVSKIINLLHWIHIQIPHDGNHNNPEILNADNMMAVCKKETRGLNCRGLATVLNECYLSLGIQSRFVTCLPKDSLGIDGDCHVINMVYSKDLKKWLWIDPTNNAYVMNEKGELLSIEEVRERLITGNPLSLNPEANYNGRSKVIKEEYLYHYMAKNLYRFQCGINYAYNTETIEKGKTYILIDLLPTDNPNQKPYTIEKPKDDNGLTWIHYYCTNPTLFWQAPKE
jgi:hypothetical protein